MTLLLEAEGLQKSYGGRRVVDGLGLSCAAGRVLGLLGPNGAGKTTTLRMLYGFITPEAGDIRYDGRSFAANRQEIKRLIGVCTQEDTLDYDFSVEQNLRVYASYFRPGCTDLRRRIDELCALFGLDAYRRHSPHALSGGFKRRLLIARSIIHQPRVLFLDEPTTGLDPQARREVWELVAKMRADGMAVLLTTHYMDEAERLSDSVVVMSKGRSVAVGTTRDIVGSLLGEHVLVLPLGTARLPEIERWAQERRLPASRLLGELHVPVSSTALAELSALLAGTEFSVRPPTLDDLFVALAQGSSSEVA